MNKRRKRQLTEWYKQYADLPVDIIKQIIDFKSNQYHDLHTRIQTIKALNEKINLYENALATHTAYNDVMSQFPDVTMRHDICINNGGYVTRIPFYDYVVELQWLKRQKQKLINSCKYDRFVKENTK